MYRTPSHAAFPLDPTRLMAERGRLVRFCARMVNSDEAAEDLAQETLLTAWRARERLHDGTVWQAWLTGIARNVCLRYLRRRAQDRQRFVEATDGGGPGLLSLDAFADNSLPDLNELMEQEEVGRLLDRAIATLPRKTHSLLIERYVEEMPLAEMAGRRGIREETVAVHLHRSRLALRKVLTGQPDLREESVALGLLDPDTCGIQETRLWCPQCGDHRLQGSFGPWRMGDKSGIQFLLFCPSCHGKGQSDFLMSLSNAAVLKGVKGFRPALKRANRWWWEHSTGTESGPNALGRRCRSCRRGTIRRVTVAPEGGNWPFFGGKRGLFSVCSDCGMMFSAIEAYQLAHVSPEGQRFWQETPRMRTLPMREQMTPDGLLIVSRFESVVSHAALDIVQRADTMELVRAVRS